MTEIFAINYLIALRRSRFLFFLFSWICFTKTTYSLHYRCRSLLFLLSRVRSLCSTSPYTNPLGYTLFFLFLSERKERIMGTKKSSIFKIDKNRFRNGLEFCFTKTKNRFIVFYIKSYALIFLSVQAMFSAKFFILVIASSSFSTSPFSLPKPIFQ